MAVSEGAVIDLCVGWFRNTVGKEEGLLSKEGQLQRKRAILEKMCKWDWGVGGCFRGCVSAQGRRRKKNAVCFRKCVCNEVWKRKSACNEKDFVFQGSQRKGLPGFDIPDDHILEGLLFCFYLFACLFGAIQVFQYFSAITIIIFLYIYIFFSFSWCGLFID